MATKLLNGMVGINISLGYELADSILNAIKGSYGEVALEDHLNPEEEAFWMKRRAPNRKTLLHDLLVNWEFGRWEDGFSGFDRESADEAIRDHLEMCRLEIPEGYPEALDAFAGGSRSQLCGLLAEANQIAAAAAFHLLFSDREFLSMFGRLVARAATSDLARNSVHFSDARVPRPKKFPTWLVRAIYFRDQGRCQACSKDVSGLLHLDNRIHCDHVLPLARGGTNDPTNLQLLCDSCNLRKSDKIVLPKNRIEPFW